MVFQRFNLFPHKTAMENVIEAPIHVLGISKKDAMTRRTSCYDASGYWGSATRTRESSRAASSSVLQSHARSQ